MSTSARRLHYTYAQYLALEEHSGVRHEFLDGEIYAMAGGSPDHAALAAALIRIVGSQLPPGCRAFTSDLRVRIAATGLTTYPDVAVIRGPTLRTSEDPPAVANPVFLVEITSPSTEDYDRGEKLRHYESLPSLREVLFVSHRAPQLTLHRRGDAEWTATTAQAGDVLELSSVGARIAVDELYRDGLEDAGG
jgi:Uma2 family endonuclease